MTDSPNVVDAAKFAATSSSKPKPASNTTGPKMQAKMVADLKRQQSRRGLKGSG